MDDSSTYMNWVTEDNTTAGMTKTGPTCGPTRQSRFHVDRGCRRLSYAWFGGPRGSPRLLPWDQALPEPKWRSFLHLVVGQRQRKMSAEIESWKQEPVSPDWFEIDEWVDYGDATILEDIDFIIKEEPEFPVWAENTSVLEGGFVGSGVESSGNVVGGPVGWVEETKTSELLQEFEDVLTRALTPPDSPERAAIGVSSPPQHLQPFYHPTLVHLQTPARQIQQLQNTIQSQEESSINEIDAIVAESFTNGDYMSSSDSGYEDPDWAPAVNKTRSSPYPSIEERKARKKEQNKNAATRYRQKKKQEIEVILTEEKDLQDKNDTLKAEVDEIKREMKYLKSLLRHIFKAKGMIR